MKQSTGLSWCPLYLQLVFPVFSSAGLLCLLLLSDCLISFAFQGGGSHPVFLSPASVAPGHRTSSHSLLLLFHHFNFLLPWGPLRLIGWWRHRFTSIPYIDLASYWPRSSCQNLKNSADPSLLLKKDRSQSISEIAANPAEWHRCLLISWLSSSKMTPSHHRPRQNPK